MNIFARIGDYITGKRLSKLERDLKMLESRAKFVPTYSKLPAAFFADDTFTRKVTEYLVWYTGNEDILRQFFTNNGHIAKDGISPNFFWEKCLDNYPMKHSGFPALISAKMATILFGKGYTIEAEVFTSENGDTINETASATLQSVITDTLIPKMNFDRNLSEAAANESWGGHVFLKLSYDISITPYPILEVVDIRNAEEINRRGHTVGIVFKFYYEKKVSGSDPVSYRLDEIYRTATPQDFKRDKEGVLVGQVGEEGDAVIEYRLYRLTKNGGEERVPLDTIPETAEIERDAQVFAGIKGILAASKPNKLPNNDFIDSPYGASDYAHSRTAFDALDEVASELARETRDNKSIISWPAGLLPKDENGKMLLRSSFRTNVVKSEMDQSEGAENKIEVFEFNDKTASLMEKYKQNLVLVCNNAEISPLALGITGLESIAASDTSQRERNKATIETRNKKLQLWTPVIEDILMKSVELAQWMQKSLGVKQQGIENLGDISFANTNIKITFPDYIIDNQTEIATTWATVKSAGGSSTYTYVKKLHPEWDDDKIQKEVQQILFERGMQADNPETLLLNNITTQTP